MRIRPPKVQYAEIGILCMEMTAVECLFKRYYSYLYLLDAKVLFFPSKKA